MSVSTWLLSPATVDGIPKRMRLPSEFAFQNAKLRGDTCLPFSAGTPRGAFGSQGTFAIVR